MRKKPSARSSTHPEEEEEGCPGISDWLAEQPVSEEEAVTAPAAASSSRDVATAPKAKAKPKAKAAKAKQECDKPKKADPKQKPPGTRTQDSSSV